MAVLNCIAIVAGIILIECNALRIAIRHADFINAVINLFSVLVFVKAGPCIFPAVTLVKCYSSSNIHTVSFQLHAYAFRLQGILVFTVIPDLFNRNLDLFCFMTVVNATFFS